jgi:hypothetical protein
MQEVSIDSYGACLNNARLAAEEENQKVSIPFFFFYASRASHARMHSMRRIN